MPKSEFGVIGLGVMGRNLSLNIAEKGYSLSVYNRAEGTEINMVSDFLSKSNFKTVSGHIELKDFVESLSRPRKILLMIKSGQAVDSVISKLLLLLEKDDIVIDGGNSYYKDTEKRQYEFLKNGFHFIGCGISGGAKGARFGPSLMPSGNKRAFKQIEDVLNPIAAKDINNSPCCSYIGVGGSGHFVKMIHNGIEYAEMQLLAELYDILRTSMSNEEIANLLEEWNKTELQSFLLGITINILRTKENDLDLIDLILDKSGNKGTGFWSVREAMEAGLNVSMMAAALNARFTSARHKDRQHFAKKLKTDNQANCSLNLTTIKEAYTFSRIINHHQGFSVLREVGKMNNYDLNLSEIARIWTNGCIIRSGLMEELTQKLSKDEEILGIEEFFTDLKSKENALALLISEGLQTRKPLPCFYAAYNFWLSTTTKRLPANLIQAQRDYFGGHTFQRIDKPDGEHFSFKWENDA